MRRTRLLILAVAPSLVVGAACRGPQTPRPAAPRVLAALGTDTSAIARVVQAQVEAYNRRDLPAFLAVFAPEVRLYAFPDSLLYAGRDTLRVVYGQLFSRASTLHAAVTRRVVQGAYVLDQEVTTGLPGRGPLTGVAIYEVRAGRITRVWFLD